MKLSAVEQATSSGAVWADLIRAIGAEDPDKLRVAASAVAELEAHPGWSTLRGLLEGKVDGLHRMILPPARHDHASYIALTNQEYALRFALDLPAVVQAVAKDADDKRRLAAERAAARKG